jgi:hypothetical protein
MASAEAAPEKKQYRASSAVALKTLSAWEQANLSPWYHPRFWLDLLIHPSKEFTMNHQRRRARLYALVSFIFVIVSVIANIIFASDGRPKDFLATHAVVNVMLGVSYIISRTKYAQTGKTLGVFAVWLLPYVTFILNLRDGSITDVTVTDSVSWLFTPAWMLMSAIFLSRSATVGVVMLDCFSLLLLPSFADCSFFAIRKLLLFHIVCNSLLLMASIIAFRDKLQLYSQHDGQSHEDQHQAGTFSRFLLQPHNEITDRIFRRRSRVLSAFHLLLIPSMLVWLIVESTRLSDGKSDGVVVGLTAVLFVASIFLYVLSRSQYTRWASRLTLFMLLIAPYIYYQAPSTTMEGQLFANLITMTSAAILGVTLFSGAELVALAAIIFFPTVYSPLFPPHVILSLILLVSSFIYRRDIKEIHDTAFHRDDLYEDDTSDLLIPWEKKYFFGKLSYIQMVQAHYLFGFFMIATLGLAALVGVATSDQKVLDTVSATVVSSEDQADYVIYVTANNCPSPIAQVYTVTGTSAYFEVKNMNPINELSINSIYVSTSGNLVGPVVSISLKLGDGSYSLTQYETCSIQQIEVWDPVDQISYSTSTSQLDSVQNQQGATGRRLLKNDDRDDDNSRRPMPTPDPDCGPNANPIQVNGFFGQLVAQFVELPVCRFQIPGVKQDQCQKYLQTVGVSPLSWSASACGAKGTSNSDRLLPCYELGCSANTRTCNGHGTCVILRQLAPGAGGRASHFRSHGGWSKQNLVAACQCDPGYFGDRCEQTKQQFCAGVADDTYSYDGECISIDSPDAGAVGQPTPRLGTASYIGRRFTTPTTPAVVPVATGLTPNRQNMLGVGFIDFVTEDIIGPARSANTGSRTPNLDPFSAWCSLAPQYANTETSWIDASPIYGTDPTARPILAGDISGHIDHAAVKAQYATGFSPEFLVVLDFMLAFHDHAADIFSGGNGYSGYDNPGIIGQNAAADTSTSDRFELARYLTIMFLQNIVRYHILPSFFNVHLAESLLANALTGDPVTEQQGFDAFFAATTFIPGHYFNRATTPLGEVPLAAGVNLLTTLEATPSNPQCTLPDLDSMSMDYIFPPSARGEALFQLITTQAQPFGTAPASSAATSAYIAAQQASLAYGLPSLAEETANLLGTTPPPATSAVPNFFNDLHHQVKPPGQLWSPTELALTTTDPLYSSTYPPVALWLTFGIIRDAYLSDPHNFEIARTEGFSAWTVDSNGVVTAQNLLAILSANCDLDSANCEFILTAFLEELVQDAFAFQNFIDYYLDPVNQGNALRECSNINYQAPALLAPLLAAQDPAGTNTPINDLSRCCLSAGCNVCLPPL